MIKPITTPGRNPLTMIPARITRTTTYSTFGSVLRLSQTQSTMNDSAEEDQHAPDDHARDQLDHGRAEHEGGERDERSDESRGPRVDVHALREGRHAQRVIPRDTAERAGDDVEETGVAELFIRVEVAAQHELGATDVEQDPDHGDEHHGGDACGLPEHRPPVGSR